MSENHEAIVTDAKPEEADMAVRLRTGVRSTRRRVVATGSGGRSG